MPVKFKVIQPGRRRARKPAWISAKLHSTFAAYDTYFKNQQVRQILRQIEHADDDRQAELVGQLKEIGSPYAMSQLAVFSK